MFDGPLMCSVVDMIHLKVNKFVMSVKIKAIIDSKLKTTLAGAAAAATTATTEFVLCL